MKQQYNFYSLKNYYDKIDKLDKVLNLYILHRNCKVLYKNIKNQFSKFETNITHVWRLLSYSAPKKQSPLHEIWTSDENRVVTIVTRYKLQCKFNTVTDTVHQRNRQPVYPISQSNSCKHLAALPATHQIVPFQEQGNDNASRLIDRQPLIRRVHRVLRAKDSPSPRSTVREVREASQ